MNHGKKICAHLKVVRKQIADANDIPYEITECPHQGPCAGTCPKCESELRYIENQLTLRRAAGKAVSIVGLSLGISTAFMATGCTPTTKTAETVETPTQKVEEPEEYEGEIVFPVQSRQQKPLQSKDSTNEKIEDYFLDGDVEIPIPDEIIVQYKSQNSEDSVVQIDETAVYSIAEEMPEFPGGATAMESFIKKNLRCPDRTRSIRGKVFLSFIVEKDGSITNIEVLRSREKICSQEAIRVVKLMPKWKPGKIKGSPVRVKQVLPITFTFIY